jgi:hypothetical protein
MDRQDFLKKAGVGSVGLASLGALAEVAWAGAGGNDGRTRFYFVALSGQTSTLTGGESIVMTGCGDFDHGVKGGGEFVHFDGRTIPSSHFIATASWKARSVLSFTEIGTWGTGVAGILELGIDLRPCDEPAIRGATLKIVCNLGPAGLINDPFQQEGYTLTVPGLAPFAPFTPNIGLTFFSRRC